VIGIPLGVANFKLINVCLRPFGRQIVSIREARLSGADPAAIISNEPRKALPPVV
jgi:uncharacterized membrane protein YccF (DUF307 family)